MGTEKAVLILIIDFISDSCLINYILFDNWPYFNVSL